MTYKDILALAHAGYSVDQIGKLAMLEQTQPVQQVQQTQPVQPVQQTQPVQQVQQTQPVQQTQQFDYQAMMAELLGIKNAIQTGNVQTSQQPEQPMTADQIMANIIAPKPIKKEE